MRKETDHYLKKFGDSVEKHFGSRHPMHCQAIKDKVRNTTEERWGGIGFASEEIHKKYEDTCIERFGVSNGGGSEQALKKIIDTKMERYGHPYFVFPMGEHGMYSKGEKEVLEFVRSIYSGTIIENDRTQMTPNDENHWIENHELDIWLPDIKVAIEYNGTYWHNLPNIIESDHFKRIQCESKGINLISISEEEWDSDIEKCKGKIVDVIRRKW